MARVENYFRVNQVREDGLKATTLLYVCGQETFDIAKNLVAPAPLESITYTELKKMLREHFEPKLSVIAWRHTFEQRDQRPGESGADFIATLRQAARPCEFKDLEERLRDRLVCCLRSHELQQKIFAKEDVSFQDALREITAEEAAGEAVKVLRLSKHPMSSGSIHQEVAQDFLFQFAASLVAWGDSSPRWLAFPPPVDPYAGRKSPWRVRLLSRRLCSAAEERRLLQLSELSLRANGEEDRPVKWLITLLLQTASQRTSKL